MFESVVSALYPHYTAPYSRFFATYKKKKKKQRKNTLNNRKVGEVLLGRVTSVLPSCVCHVILCQQPSHLTSGYSVWRDTQPLLNKISKASKQKTSFRADQKHKQLTLLVFFFFIDIVFQRHNAIYISIVGINCHQRSSFIYAPFPRCASYNW